MEAEYATPDPDATEPAPRDRADAPISRRREARPSSGRVDTTASRQTARNSGSVHSALTTASDSRVQRNVAARPGGPHLAQPMPASSTRVQRSTRPTGGTLIQRAVIPHGPIDGLVADLDTADLAASKAQIEAMWNGGKRRGLVDLYAALGQADPEAHPANNAKLRKLVSTHLNAKSADDPEAGSSGGAATWLFDVMNPAGDETGIVNTPGIGPQLPAAPTPLQTAALHVRSWQIGDLVDMISWSTLGAHLQGRMAPLDYVKLGAEILGRHDLLNHTNHQGTTLAPYKVHVAKTALDRVRGEVHGALNGLPSKPGVSYRMATSAPGVYGNTINVGDHIKDMSFWSTAGLKLTHQGKSFGDEGTVAVPQVYTIIQGSTGVFLPRFTNTETGAREVLFQEQTIFRVEKITNYANRTYFVHVSEVDPNTFPPIPPTKNPWSGANNP